MAARRAKVVLPCFPGYVFCRVEREIQSRVLTSAAWSGACNVRRCLVVSVTLLQRWLAVSMDAEPVTGVRRKLNSAGSGGER